MAKRRLWRDTAPARGSALLLWMAWVSVLAWVALATQFDTWQWQRSVPTALISSAVSTPCGQGLRQHGKTLNAQAVALNRACRGR